MARARNCDHHIYIHLHKYTYIYIHSIISLTDLNSLIAAPAALLLDHALIAKDPTQDIFAGFNVRMRGHFSSRAHSFLSAQNLEARLEAIRRPSLLGRPLLLFCWRPSLSLLGWRPSLVDLKGEGSELRGEASKHVDTLAWEKGRESSFNAAALFYTKALLVLCNGNHKESYSCNPRKNRWKSFKESSSHTQSSCFVCTGQQGQCWRYAVTGSEDTYPETC